MEGGYFNPDDFLDRFADPEPNPAAAAAGGDINLGYLNPFEGPEPNPAAAGGDIDPGDHNIIADPAPVNDNVLGLGHPGGFGVTQLSPMSLPISNFCSEDDMVNTMPPYVSSPYVAQLSPMSLPISNFYSEDDMLNSMPPYVAPPYVAPIEFGQEAMFGPAASQIHAIRTETTGSSVYFPQMHSLDAQFQGTPNASLGHPPGPSSSLHPNASLGHPPGPSSSWHTTIQPEHVVDLSGLYHATTQHENLQTHPSHTQFQGTRNEYGDSSVPGKESADPPGHPSGPSSSLHTTIQPENLPYSEEYYNLSTLVLKSAMKLHKDGVHKSSNELIHDTKRYLDYMLHVKFIAGDEKYQQLKKDADLILPREEGVALAGLSGTEKLGSDLSSRMKFKGGGTHSERKSRMRGKSVLIWSGTEHSETQSSDYDSVKGGPKNNFGNLKKRKGKSVRMAKGGKCHDKKKKKKNKDVLILKRKSRVYNCYAHTPENPKLVDSYWPVVEMEVLLAAVSACQVGDWAAVKLAMASSRHIEEIQGQWEKLVTVTSWSAFHRHNSGIPPQVLKVVKKLASRTGEAGTSRVIIDSGDSDEEED